MKYPPFYPDYRVVVPPGKKRWGVAWLLGVLLSVFCTLWLWPEEKTTYALLFWFWSIIFPSFVIGLLFALRSLVYQVASGNQKTYRHIMQRAEEQWWQKNSAWLPIEPWCLSGPVGDNPEHHLAAMIQNIPPPEPVTTVQGSRMLRCPQILENDIYLRETALVRHLANMLLDVYPEKSSLPPIFQVLYWCGAPEEGQRFIQVLGEKGWEFQEQLLPLNDIEQLDNVIDHYACLSGDKEIRILCAGVYCAKYEGGDSPVMGEAGFVWCAGTQGKVRVQRAERQDASEETAKMLTERTAKMAGLTSPPQYFLAFNKRSAEYLQSAGWSTQIHSQSPLWGELQKISPFAAMTMAAFQALQTEHSCGWITQDIERKCITGVISVGK